MKKKSMLGRGLSELMTALSPHFRRESIRVANRAAQDSCLTDRALLNVARGKELEGGVHLGECERCSQRFDWLCREEADKEGRRS